MDDSRHKRIVEGVVVNIIATCLTTVFSFFQGFSSIFGLIPLSFSLRDTGAFYTALSTLLLVGIILVHHSSLIRGKGSGNVYRKLIVEAIICLLLAAACIFLFYLLETLWKEMHNATWAGLVAEQAVPAAYGMAHGLLSGSVVCIALALKGLIRR